MLAVRAATAADHPAIVELYNHHVVNTPVTFDTTPFTVETRRPWFEQFADWGRYRLLVAVEDDRLLGYVGSFRYRPKAAYETSVETTIYVQPELARRGVGTRLYQALFAELQGQDVHRALAGVTLPNDASMRLHQKLGFAQVAHFTEQGRKLGRFWDVAWLEKPL